MERLHEKLARLISACLIDQVTLLKEADARRRGGGAATVHLKVYDAVTRDKIRRMRAALARHERLGD